jgi:NAD(P)-dependent dehydrogenase (short-subunit alcohol dehydrogenase family)
LGVVEAVARLWAAGVSVSWSEILGGPRGWVDLPTYAFQRDHYWLTQATGARRASEPDEATGRFWTAVENEDLDALTATLTGPTTPPEGQEVLRAALPLLTGWRRGHRDRAELGSLRYRITWQPRSFTGTPTGRWLVVAPAGEAWTPAVTEALSPAEVDTCIVGDAELDRTTLTGLLRDAAGDPDRLTGVVSLLALDERPHPEHPATSIGLSGTALLVQALGDLGTAAPLWCLTRGAVSASADGPAVRPVQAEAWGLGRVVALEQPHRWGGLVDLPAEPDARSAALLGAVITAPAASGGEDQIAIRTQGAFVRRLARAAADAPAREAWRPGTGTVLVTGGTGALGATLARWLSANGATHLLLTGRRGPDAPGLAALTTELSAAGTRVDAVACDVGDRAAVRALLAGIPADRPLTAVFHLAGVAYDDPVDTITAGHLASVLRAKAGGADHLHELTAAADLSAFVLFSSSAGVWGSGNQGAYAAANAHLIALAQARRAQGRPATAVAWGPWRGAGMMADESVTEHMRRRGLGTVESKTALAALQQALDGSDPCPTVARVEWGLFARTFAAMRPSPLLGDLPEVRQALAAQAETEPAADGGRAEAFLRQLAELADAERLDTLEKLVCQEAALVLGHRTGAAIDPAAPFKDLGFDSLTGVDLRNRVGVATGLKLPATIVFDRPNPRAFAAELDDRLGGHRPSAATVFADLDRIDLTLGRLDLGGAARHKVAGRLRVLLAKWGEPGDAEPGTRTEIESADADEIFALIREEFGKA